MEGFIGFSGFELSIGLALIGDGLEPTFATNGLVVLTSDCVRSVGFVSAVPLSVRVATGAGDFD